MMFYTFLVHFAGMLPRLHPPSLITEFRYIHRVLEMTPYTALAYTIVFFPCIMTDTFLPFFRLLAAAFLSQLVPKCLNDTLPTLVDVSSSFLSHSLYAEHNIDNLILIRHSDTSTPSLAGAVTNAIHSFLSFPVFSFISFSMYSKLTSCYQTCSVASYAAL